MKNLWPDFGDINDGLSPKDILKIQANNLRSATKGLIKGVINSSQIGGQQMNFNELGGRNSFVHTFSIYSSRLDYSFNLLSLTHETIKIYPCSIESEISKVEENVDSEEKLEQVLKKIFNHKEVTIAIRSLILQSRSENEEPIDSKTSVAIDDLPF